MNSTPRTNAQTRAEINRLAADLRAREHHRASILGYIAAVALTLTVALTTTPNMAAAGTLLPVLSGLIAVGAAAAAVRVLRRNRHLTDLADPAYLLAG